MSKDMIFQDVFDLVKTSLPDGWKNVVFFVWISEGCQEIKYYIKTREDLYVDCFQLEKEENTTIVNLLQIMDRIVMWRSENWKMMTIQYDCNQECKVFFDYSSGCDDYETIVTSWKKNYLV